MEYLTELGKTEILKLGLVLGLSNPKLEANMTSDNFLIPVIGAWLWKEDYVKKKVTNLDNPRKYSKASNS